jgi:hypothetical protein
MRHNFTIGFSVPLLALWMLIASDEGLSKTFMRFTTIAYSASLMFNCSAEGR